MTSEEDDVYQVLDDDNSLQRQNEFWKFMHQAYSVIFSEQIAIKLKDLLNITVTKRNQIITQKFLQKFKTQFNNFQTSFTMRRSSQLDKEQMQKIFENNPEKKSVNKQITEQKNHKLINIMNIRKNIQKIKQQQQNCQMGKQGNFMEARLLQGQILQDNLQQRQYLIETIQKSMKKKAIRTKLLYKYDSLNNTNFHKYIDNHVNLLFIVQLQNKHRVAVFSSGQIAPKKPSNQYGVIISLTNRMIFQPQSQNPSYRSFIYQQFYFIFGNSQIRLKTNSDTIFSNFGILARFFQKKDQTVDILFGNGSQRQNKLSSYQFYQVYFQ